LLLLVTAQVYHTLAQSRNVSVMVTLAYSLHEVARLLGEGSLVEEELVPVFEEMIQDTEVVQMGVIKHLAKFLAMLPELCRVSYLPLLHDILHSTNPFNWRLRRHLAVQLPDLVLLPPKQDLYRTLFPTVMILLQDPVASVRRVTFEGVTALLNNLFALAASEAATSGAESPQAVMHRQNGEDVIAAINSFATGEKYQLRQLWCELCVQLLKDLERDVFETYFIEGVLTLTCDTVTNVRVALSEFLVGWDRTKHLPPWLDEEPTAGDDASSTTNNIDSTAVTQLNSFKSTATNNTSDSVATSASASATAGGAETAAAEPVTRVKSPWHWLLRRSDIKHCVERLCRDDNDIYLNLSKLAPLYPDIKFSSMSCRGRKTPPGGITPVPLNAAPMTVHPVQSGDGSEAALLAAVTGLSNCSVISDDTSFSERMSSVSADETSSTKSRALAASEGRRSRSGTLDISPIGIDVISSTRSPSAPGYPPVLDTKDFSAITPSVSSPAAGGGVGACPLGILADEVDLMEGVGGFIPMVAPEEERMLFAAGMTMTIPMADTYDRDEDEENEAEEALIKANLAAMAAAAAAAELEGEGAGEGTSNSSSSSNSNSHGDNASANAGTSTGIDPSTTDVTDVVVDVVDTASAADS
jgi:hypothetical protein